MDPSTSAPSTSKPAKPRRMPSVRGTLRLSEEDYEKLIPVKMRPYWPTMPEKQKKDVKKLIANTQYLKRECRNLEPDKVKYQREIASYETINAGLQEDLDDLKGKVEVNLHIQEQLKKDLQKNEEELSKEKAEVRRQLKNKKEADSLKNEISSMKKEIKDKRNKVIKYHNKINLKAAQEKEVYNDFGQSLSALKDLRDIIEKHGLLPQKKLDDLNDNITDFQFDLALYEDDDEKIAQFNKEFEINFPEKIAPKDNLIL